MRIGLGIGTWLRRVLGGAAGSTLLNGLVSYWPLNEVSGVRYDAVGSNDLTDNNTVGAKLRGPEGTVAVPILANTEDLSVVVALPTTFTAAIWFKGNSGDNFGMMFSAKDGILYGLSGASEYSSYPGAALVAAQMYDGIAWRSVSGWGGTYGGGNSGWHLAVVVVDNTAKTMEVYRDGVSIGQTAFTGTPGDFATTDTLRVGSYTPFNTLGSTAGIAHQLSSAGFWSRAFSVEDITALFASGNGLRYSDLPAGLLTGLVSWWELDEVSGVRYDSHGSNHLTDNNTVGSVISAGDAMDGAAASFVAANSETLSAPAFDSSQPYTLAFWANGVDTISNGIIWINGNTSTYLLINGAAATWYHEKSGGFSSIGHQSLISAGWHLFICEMDGSALNYYMDDVASVSNPVACISPTQSGAVPFALGGYTGYMTTSRIDEVAIWDRVLTADERAELFAAGRGKFYDFS